MTRKDYEAAAKIVRDLRKSKMMKLPNTSKGFAHKLWVLGFASVRVCPSSDKRVRAAHCGYVMSVNSVALAFVQLFSDDNPRFDRGRFEEACLRR